MCSLNAFRIATPIELFQACVVDTSTIFVVVLLGYVTMCNLHVRMGRDSDPFSFDARVNATRILISILVNRDLDRDPVSLLRVSGVKLCNQ